MANAKCTRCPNVGYTTPATMGNVPPDLGVGSEIREQIVLCSTCRAKAVAENEAARRRSHG